MREQRLMELFFHRNCIITMEELCEQTKLSKRTITRIINNIHVSRKQYGADIKNVRGKGYCLHIENEIVFKNYLNHPHDYKSSMDDQRLRLKFLAFYLFQQKDFVSYQQIADEFAISRSTVIRDLKVFEKEVQLFQLEIQKLKYKGIKIIGDEVQYRKAYSHYVLQNNIYQEHKEIMKQIEVPIDENQICSKLKSLAQSHNMELSDLAMKNLVGHIYVLVSRSIMGNFIKGESDIEINEEYQPFLQDLITWIKAEYCITLPKSEEKYLYTHLTGNTVMETQKKQDDYHLQETIEKILHLLDQEFMTEFTKDEELKRALILHMYPLIHRLYYHLQLSNPLIDEVYSQFMNVFVVAYRFSECIDVELGYHMNRDEVGFVAMHFASYFERLMNKQMSSYRHIIVISNATGGMNTLLQAKVQSVFPTALVSVQTHIDEEQIKLNSVDLILNASNSQVNSDKVDIITIKGILDDFEIAKIKDLIRLYRNIKDHNTISHPVMQLFHENLFQIQYEEIEYLTLLKQNGEQLVKSGYANPSFPAMVLNREMKYTTIYRNGIAGPHAIEMNAIEDCIHVTILKKPICYQEKQVQIIFLINLKKGHLFLHTEISRFLFKIMNTPYVNKHICKINDYKGFLTLLEQIEESQVKI